MPKCGDVMTPDPVACEPDEAITRVAGLMKREDVGAIPVVETKASRRLVGIVTDRDIVVKVVADGAGSEERDGPRGHDFESRRVP